MTGRPRSRALALLAASALLADLAGNASGAEPMPEYRAKAYFLRNCVQYIEWPEEAFAEADGPFVVGIFGFDPFGAEIDRAFDGRTGGGRPVEVRRISLPEEAVKCQLVFISSNERHRQAQVLEQLRGHGILTVGESDWFLQLGGGIRLSIGRNGRGGAKTRFEVNLAVLREEGLAASSRMLDLAERVVR